LFGNNWAYVLSLTKISTNIIWTWLASNFVFKSGFFDWEFYQEYVYAIEGLMKVVIVYSKYKKWRFISCLKNRL
ncbi:hypothetical protein V7034_26890, partial [Priestia megaterium]|uniref:hypothetical protein n=1 Tax=Priestia megaterium TaxID=1404 RepID=UPI002FFD5DE5